MELLTVGSLCSGVGGIETAVQALLPTARVAWVVEADPWAAKVLAQHRPGARNLGDITEVDWCGLDPVDVVTAGWPCQDMSDAGTKVGISGRRSGLWQYLASAVCVLRPRLVFLENVAAIRTRGLDVVLGDLSQIGYDASWVCLHASDVGAPHRRTRWFAIAHPTDADPDRLGRYGGAGDLTEAHGWDEPAHRRRPVAGRLKLLPTPTAHDWRSGLSNIMDRSARPLNEYAVNRLSTVRMPDATWVSSDGVDFGPAIRRWEAVTGRCAPCPTEAGTKGNRRLASAFSEWMMGFPPGYVTGLGVPRREELRMIGSACMPQQALAAYRSILTRTRSPAALAVP